MHHSLKLSIGKKPRDGAVALRQLTVREKLLRFFFGASRKVLVLVPGDTVKELAITDITEGGGEGE